MQSSNIPTKIPLPFAYNAGVGYKNTIPTASQIGVVNGRASLNDGFPPLNFVPISSGGVPPFGSDVNGILNEITAITQWQQAGGFFFYDSSFSTTIGGYPKGAILQSSSNSGLWISTAENNTTNPDTGGAGWMSLAFEGSQAITVTTADVTVTQLQSAYPVLIISGALTAARSLIMPAIVGEWIVQNNTTGAFNLTVKTASGTGVVATQSQSTFLYGDGTNILFADSSKVASFNGRVGTVTLNATDVTTALGYTPIGPNLTGAVTSVGNATTVVTNANLTGAVTSTGNSTSLGSFSSAQLASALTDETGTGANVFANSPTLSSPTFTTPVLGTPTSGNLANCSFPTLNQNTTGTARNITDYPLNQGVGTGDSPSFQYLNLLGAGGAEGSEMSFAIPITGTSFSGTVKLDVAGNAFRVFSTNAGITKVFSFDFTNGAGILFTNENFGTYAPSSLSGNGYQKLPSGLIMQWGSNGTPAGSNNVVVNFPIAFTSAVYSVTGNAYGFAGYNGDQVQFNAVNTSNFRAYTTTASVAFYWFAIGR